MNQQNKVIYSDIMTNLETAQRLLENVYNYSQDIKNKNIENLMSVADSCIIDAKENLRNINL